MASQESTNDEDVLKDIAEPRETDVLCGRGGAALRHAGNQTYRRLVNLNKGLYITCMKTEKLKISRSIVAAIREQKGRFLERDAKKGVWFDIGDKKAVEKTSQALREGQPKLRKKMVEMGQLPPDQANGGIDPVPASMQQQLLQQYGNGIYNARAPQSNASNSLNGSMSGSMNGSMNMLMNNGMSIGSFSRIGSIGSGSSTIGRLESIGSGGMGRLESMGSGNMGRMESIGSGNMGRMESIGSATMGRLESIGSGGNMGRLESIGSGGNMGRLESIGSGGSMGSRNSFMLDSMQQDQQQKQMMMGRINNGRLRTNMSQMPPPPTRTFSNGTNNMNSIGGNDLTILQHLSLNSTPQSIPSWTPSMGSMESMMTMSTTDVPQMVSRRNLSRQYNRNQSYGSNNNTGNNNNNNGGGNMNSMQNMGRNPSNNNDVSDFATMNSNGRGVDRTSMVEPNKILCEKIGSFDPTEQQYRQQQQQGASTREHSPNRFSQNNSINSNEQRSNGPSISDRRRIFARMKRTNSPRTMLTSQRSITDGMPDIHMVDSQFSLLSNLSAHGSKHRGQNVIDMDISKHGLTKKDSIGSEYIGVGSRRSLMSGLSKLSGHSSDINNTFSNMSRKFTGTNHTLSSRSLTMSEFSGVGEDDDFAEEEFSFDIPTQRNS